MSVIDHGQWTPYDPAEPYLEFAGVANVLYAQRDDGKDWYTYIYEDSPFANGAVVMTLYPKTDGLVVAAATFDTTTIFPANALVLEVTGYAGSDPFADYNNKLYDPNTQTFSDRVLPVLQEDPLAAVQKRLDTLEAKLGGS